MGSSLTFGFAVTLLVFGLPSIAGAQVSYRERFRDDPKQIEAEENRLWDEQAARDRQLTDRKPGTVSVARPILSPSGEKVVALVNDRYLSESELATRVAIEMMSTGLELRHVQLSGNGIQFEPDAFSSERTFEKRRQEAAQRLLGEWVRDTTLTLHAAANRYRVSNWEIEEKLLELADSSGGDVEEVEGTIRAVGIPSSQLREEVRDAILIEKYLRDIMRKIYTNRHYRQIWDSFGEDSIPMFQIPPRVQAFHVFRVVHGAMTKGQRKDIKKEMESLRKLLRKRNPDYDALRGRSDQDRQLQIGATGWLNARAILPAGLHQALFSLEVGETSKVFQEGNGLHIVKILEREEGSGFTFETAIPQIENFIIMQLKNDVFDQLRRLRRNSDGSAYYKIRMNSGGLNEWIEVGTREEVAQMIRERGGSRDFLTPEPITLPLTIEDPGSPGTPSRIRTEPKSPPPAIDLDLLREASPRRGRGEGAANDRP